MPVQPSRLGIGTYLGNLTQECTRHVKETVIHGVQHLNLRTLDTAINYRAQRSEKLLGDLFHERHIQRESVFLITKGGFIPYDNTLPLSAAAYISKNFVIPLRLSGSDIYEDSHCLHPRYIEWSFNQSRKNLMTEKLDVYLLHNPEFALGHLKREAWETCIVNCLSFLESKVQEGSLRAYGIASWDGLRVEPNHPNHISLARLKYLCMEKFDPVHFKAVELPINPFNREFIELPNQQTENKKRVTLQEWVQENEFMVFGAAPLLQGQLIERAHKVMKPEEWNSELTTTENLLSWSLRLKGVTSTLLGTSSKEHLEEAANLLM